MVTTVSIAMFATITAGDNVILDVVTGGAGVFRWHVESPSGVVLRGSALFTDDEAIWAGGEAGCIRTR